MKRAMKSSATCALILTLCTALSGCGNGAISGTSCAGWKKILASSRDTDGTLSQVEQHNEQGRRIGCWK